MHIAYSELLLPSSLTTSIASSFNESLLALSFTSNVERIISALALSIPHKTGLTGPKEFLNL